MLQWSQIEKREEGVLKLIRDAIAIIACLLLLSGCTFLPGMTHIITFTEKSEPTVYAATNRGLSISTDGGATFTNRTPADGLGSNIVEGVYATP